VGEGGQIAQAEQPADLQPAVGLCLASTNTIQKEEGKGQQGRQQYQSENTVSPSPAEAQGEVSSREV
jgi:hypothetical protein